MADHKWADVAHYYLPIDIEFTGGYSILEYRPGGEWCIGKEGEESTFFTDWEDVEDVTDPTYCKPILGHRDDITEAEARELHKVVTGSDYDTHFDAIHYYGETHMYTRYASTFDELIGNPKAWHWYLSHGIDLFGLIESGQAIRKEKTT